MKIIRQNIIPNISKGLRKRFVSVNIYQTVFCKDNCMSINNVVVISILSSHIINFRRIFQRLFFYSLNVFAYRVVV